MRYYTGVSNEITRNAHRDDLGLLGTPAGATWRQKDCYGSWAADNGCFVDVVKPGSFKPARWLAWLAEATPAACSWATLPDVVGQAWATWERSYGYLETVRALGYRPSIVLQDGLTRELLDSILGVVDDVFIGGSTEWKLGPQARQATFAAKAAGAQVHMGRVNSLKRLRYATEIGCDSADGTYLNYGRKADRELHTLKLLQWLDIVNA